MLWLAEIKFANAPELGSILLRVIADNRRNAERKVGKYIDDNLQGQRCYDLHRFDVIKEI